MAKKQKSFADKASGNKNKDSVFVKYVRSIQSQETGGWRFNEQIIRMNKGEQLDAALKRLDEVANLSDIDLTQFSTNNGKTDKITEAKEELTSAPASQESDKNEAKEEVAPEAASQDAEDAVTKEQVTSTPASQESDKNEAKEEVAPKAASQDAEDVVIKEQVTSTPASQESDKDEAKNKDELIDIAEGKDNQKKN